MTQKLIITFNVDKGALKEDMTQETTTLPDNVIANLEHNQTSGTLMDSNGNTVGCFKLANS